MFCLDPSELGAFRAGRATWLAADGFLLHTFGYLDRWSHSSRRLLERNRQVSLPRKQPAQGSLSLASCCRYSRKSLAYSVAHWSPLGALSERSKLHWVSIVTHLDSFWCFTGSRKRASGLDQASLLGAQEQVLSCPATQVNYVSRACAKSLLWDRTLSLHLHTVGKCSQNNTPGWA